MQMSKTMKALLFAMMALVMISSLAFTPQPGGMSGWDEMATAMYKSALKMEPKLQTSLDKARTTDVANAQAYIDKLKADGKDASAVEAALATFKTKIDEAQAKHDAAKAILDVHDGFDADGNVVDVEKALDSAGAAMEALMEGNGILTEARFDLYKLIGEWQRIMKNLPMEYRAEKVMVKVTQKRLDAAAKTVTRTQTYIDKWAAKGKDVTPLVTALDAYKAAVASAQADKDNAAAILATHAGFDDQGKVIDATLAQQTVDTAGDALDSANTKLTQAAKDLSKAIYQWRKANHT